MRVWNRKKRRVEASPLTTKQLLEAFAVPPETPLLGGVLHVVRAQGLAAKEQLKIPDMNGNERAFHSGAIAACDELEERIAELVDEAQSRARGTKSRADALIEAE